MYYYVFTVGRRRNISIPILHPLNCSLRGAFGTINYSKLSLMTVHSGGPIGNEIDMSGNKSRGQVSNRYWLSVTTIDFDAIVVH